MKAVDGREFYAIEVISVFLKYLKNKFLSELSCADDSVKKASDFQWVITVPAIWKPRGKQVMREAAYLVSIVLVCILTIIILYLGWTMLR